MEIFQKNIKKQMEFDNEREKIFDELSSTWDLKNIDNSTQHVKELINSINIQGKTVLDVGAGTGVLVKDGLQNSPKKWIACDLSSEMLKVLKNKFSNESSLHTIHADVRELPLNTDTIDVVFIHNAFPHFNDSKAALTDLYRVLKKDGKLIIDHSSSRETINDFHQNVENEVLQQDYLAPTEDTIALFKELDFIVEETIETEDMYRIIVTK